MKRYVKSEDSITRLNSILKDGDTPRKLPKDLYYEIERWDSNGCSKYGRLNYTDTVGLIKGFHYEELVPGDGMWVNPSCSYYYSVEISK